MTHDDETKCAANQPGAAGWEWPPCPSWLPGARPSAEQPTAVRRMIMARPVMVAMIRLRPNAGQRANRGRSVRLRILTDAYSYADPGPVECGQSLDGRYTGNRWQRASGPPHCRSRPSAAGRSLAQSARSRPRGKRPAGHTSPATAVGHRASAAQTASVSICRSSLNLAGWSCGVICAFTDTTTDRFPFLLAATNWV